jgi:hypothetical protein
MIVTLRPAVAPRRARNPWLSRQIDVGGNSAGRRYLTAAGRRSTRGRLNGSELRRHSLDGDEGVVLEASSRVCKSQSRRPSCKRLRQRRRALQDGQSSRRAEEKLMIRRMRSGTVLHQEHRAPYAPQLHVGLACKSIARLRGYQPSSSHGTATNIAEPGTREGVALDSRAAVQRLSIVQGGGDAPISHRTACTAVYLSPRSSFLALHESRRGGGRAGGGGMGGRNCPRGAGSGDSYVRAFGVL